MREEAIISNQSLDEFLNDGRARVKTLYREYDRLLDFGFERDLIFTQILPDSTTKNGSIAFPIFGYRCWATNAGSMWFFSGTHGEEPAGPEAIAAEIDLLGTLSNKVPMVILPLCNPIGRYRDWRYENEYRDDSKGQSVTDAEHYLLAPGKRVPRRKRAVSNAAEAITRYVVEKSFVYPPEVAIDLHEDTDLPKSYVYSQSRLGESDLISRLMVEIMRDNGMEIQIEGETNVGEKVRDGIIPAVNDGSVIELITARQIYYQGQILHKPYAKSAYVVETPVYGVALPKRVETHRRILRSLEEIWELVER